MNRSSPIFPLCSHYLVCSKKNPTFQELSLSLSRSSSNYFASDINLVPVPFGGISTTKIILDLHLCVPTTVIFNLNDNKLIRSQTWQLTSDNNTTVRGKHRKTAQCIRFVCITKGGQPTILNCLFLITLFVSGTVTSHLSK